MRKSILFMLILLLLTSCQSNNEDHDLLTTEPSETTTEISRTQEERKLNITTTIGSAYEQVVIDSMEIKIRGNFEQLNDLYYEMFSEEVINNDIESYESGYGAKEISIDYMKTYDAFEALKVDEKVIPEGLEEAFNAHEDSKIIFIAYNYSNTEKTFREKVAYANYGGNGQYYVVSKFGGKYLITYWQFMGN
jgi:hypothetical protein